MNPKMDELIRQWMDDGIAEADAADLLAGLEGDSEVLREARRQYRIHRILGAQHDLNGFVVRVVRSVQALRDHGGVDRLAGSVLDRLHEEREGAVTGITVAERKPAIGPATWVRWLALAACLTIVAGVWWFSQMQDGALGLRVVQGSGEWRVAGGEGRQRTAVVGMPLRQGDRVVVGKGGKVGLKYGREETRIELMAATEAVFGSEKGAKRVNLAAGTLVCTAAPQKMPFLLETPHAIAEVIGTRFWLGVAQAETALSVQEGKVVLRQKDRSLEVKAGETAVADGAGMKKLSLEDAWIRELLVRAEAGPWDALDLKPGTIIGDPGVWRADLRGEPAARRIWQTDPRASSTVLFTAAKWKRGVIVGCVMMLPEGELPSALAVPAETPAAPWKKGPNSRLGSDPPNGVYLGFHWGSSIMSITSAMTVKDHPRGVWHRFAVYFDTDVGLEAGVALVLGAWPENRTVPSAALWNRPRKEDFGGITGNAVGLGLYAKQVSVLWQGVKVVPLSADMPPLPKGVGTVNSRGGSSWPPGRTKEAGIVNR